jgi:alpha-N-arabinofuranosidase
MSTDISKMSRRSALLGAATLGAVSALPAMAAPVATLSATIAAASTGAPINPFMYGGFIEHIGDLINHSLWSEVLDDRKFFWPVNSDPIPGPSGGGNPMRTQSNKWHPTGADATVTMDASGAYVGAHSPVVHVGGAGPLGIGQSNLVLARKDYTGRVVIAAEPGVSVSATLIWGTAPDQRQSVALPASGAWSTVPLKFACGADTKEGRLEITGTGTGAFRIGAVSLMPADNIGGFRADMIALMREMDCHLMRMPGGNFISAYDWHYTVGDPDKRPPIMDPVWHAVQPNDVGVDELLHMAQLIKAEPYWCISTGFDQPRSGAEIVEYVNGAATTEWGAKRAANGHPEPWRVKYWDVGNEMYGHWQMGHIAREQYYVKHNLFVDAMRAVDPSIYIAAPGGFADEMTTGQGIFIAGQPKVEIGSDRDWAYGMFQNCMGRFDALQTHAYPPENKHYDLETGKLVDIQQPLNEWSRGMAQRIQTMADCWDAYKKHFPELNTGKIKVFFDEWAYHFQPDLKGCLGIASGLHEFYRHTDFIDAAAYTMATGWLSFDRTNAVISATGRVFQLYNQHFGVIPVQVTGNSPVPGPKYPIGGDQPSVNTGSPTWPLDVSAALTRDRKALIVAVVNATEQPQSLKLDVQGFGQGVKSARSGRSWRLAGPNLEAQNRVGAAPQVTIEERTFNPRAGTLSLAPISVELFEFRTA